MARQRKLSPERKAFINSLLEHYQPNAADDVQDMLKDLLGDTLQGMLEAEIQRCIVHQIRYTTKFVSYKDLKPFMKDLKLVYKADTEELALEALDVLEENWGSKYPSSIAFWRNNWP